MTQPDIQDETAAGKREYALAKAYTEARTRFGARVLQAKFIALLLLVLMPFGYAALMPVASDGLDAVWFRAWTEATAGLGRLLLVGGLAFALGLVLLGFGLVHVFFIDHVMSDGALFRDAHYYCVESRRAGRISRCIEYSEYGLAETVWKLGWMSSLAALLVPSLLWIGIVSLHYPLWLIAGRPWRSE